VWRDIFVRSTAGDRQWITRQRANSNAASGLRGPRAEHERRITRPVGAALAGLALGPSLAAQTPRLGMIDFPTSGAPAASAPFLRGVLLLHSFEYGDAALVFRARDAVVDAFSR
jgi:hypothetical protein